jgi:aldehyde:ferredoxin oxidoreductase
VNFLARKVLLINLSDSTSDVKSFTDLNEYLGGFALGLKLYEMYQDKDPVILSVGPLSGLFPFVSKTSIVMENNGAIEDIYLGGSFSSRLASSGVDSIILLGRSKSPTLLEIFNDKTSFLTENIYETNSLGLPGKRSVLSVINRLDLLDNYFVTKDNLLGKKLASKNVTGIVLTGSLAFDIPDLEGYSALYAEVLKRAGELEVTMGSSPSCSGCPLGCGSSKVGEMGGNILAHCLVSCEYAKKIYSDVNIVFSCLNVLGYDYKHEDLEKVPGLVDTLLNNI